MLWKAALWSDGLAMNIGPHFVDGRRAYHYNMPLPDGAGPAVSGAVNPGGTVTMLAEAGDPPADPADVASACIAVARLLTEAGLPGRCRLDEISRAGLAEVGAFAEPPMTVGELAAEGKGTARP
jgi:hypothetical protein